MTAPAARGIVLSRRIAGRLGSGSRGLTIGMRGRAWRRCQAYGAKDDAWHAERSRGWPGRAAGLPRPLARPRRDRLGLGLVPGHERGVSGLCRSLAGEPPRRRRRGPPGRTGLGARQRRTNTVPALREYLEAHPRGAFAPDARLALDELRWQDVQAAGTIPELERYLQEHPTGLHAPTARLQLEDLHWAEARADGTLAGYDRLPRVLPGRSVRGRGAGGDPTTSPGPRQRPRTPARATASTCGRCRPGGTSPRPRAPSTSCGGSALGGPARSRRTRRTSGSSLAAPTGRRPWPRSISSPGSRRGRPGPSSRPSSTCSSRRTAASPARRGSGSTTSAGRRRPRPARSRRSRRTCGSSLRAGTSARRAIGSTRPTGGRPARPARRAPTSSTCASIQTDATARMPRRPTPRFAPRSPARPTPGRHRPGHR